jgi:hypothetical protein
MKERNVRRNRPKKVIDDGTAVQRRSVNLTGAACTSQSKLELKRWLLVDSCVGSTTHFCGRAVACAYLEARLPPKPPAVAPRAGGLIGLLGRPC